MKRPCSNNRFHLIPSLLLLSLSLVPPGLAAEVPLRSFTASYDLHKGGMHVAVSEVSLQQMDQLWRWRATTAARGIYAGFIKSKPYFETSFIQANGEIKIQQILHADPGNPEKDESASFDWARGSLEVLRKGRHKQLKLDAEVYDYQIIHLLAVSMRMQQLNEATVDFYRKGKITRSTLVYSGTGNLDVNGKTVVAEIFEQMIVRSKTNWRYYYAAETPLLPLRIEKFKPGETTVTLTLSKVNWGL
ncbi:MAG: DUF3108 domain-containing protein [Gammaproteobacteria bacterium]